MIMIFLIFFYGFFSFWKPFKGIHHELQLVEYANSFLQPTATKLIWADCGYVFVAE